MSKHKKVGRVYYAQLSETGHTADIIVRRPSHEVSPVQLGQLILLTMDTSRKSYLALVKSHAPDIPSGVSSKDAIRLSQEINQEIDPIYEEQFLSLNYRCAILGACKESGEGDEYSVAFYPGARELPSLLKLHASIPSPEFMRIVLKDGASSRESDSDLVIQAEIGNLVYGTNPESNQYYKPGTKDEVRVPFNAGNLFSKRSAIFGKSGYGKSNAVKTTIGMMANTDVKFGMLIIDTNGEYGFDNNQNKGLASIFSEAGRGDRIVVYSNAHFDTKKYQGVTLKSLRFDVYKNPSMALSIIKSRIDSIALSNPPQYIQPWLDLVEERIAPIHLIRMTLKTPTGGLICGGMYFDILRQTGINPVRDPKNQNAHPKHTSALRISKDAVSKILKAYEAELPEPERDPKKRDSVLLDYGITKEGNHFVTNDIETIIMSTHSYLDKLGADSESKASESSVRKRAKLDEDGEAEENELPRLTQYLKLIKHPSCTSRFDELKHYHVRSYTTELRTLPQQILADIEQNKIVIIDIPSVGVELGDKYARMVLTKLMSTAQEKFQNRDGTDSLKDFNAVVVMEEAQNYLNSNFLKKGSIYERLAKEGRKFHIGLVYVTQQPSAIDASITSQTENIIALHLSNSSDSHSLNKIKDKFDLLTCSFLKDEAVKGLAYIYQEPSQPFVVPCQIDLFDPSIIRKGK